MILGLLCADAWAVAGLIQRLPLTGAATYEVGIDADTPTTIVLPAAPTALEGVGFTSSPNDAAPVFLQYSPGSRWFTVRALFPDAQANLNVMLGDLVCTFHFAFSAAPTRTLTLFPSSEAGSAAGSPPRRAPITVRRLMALMQEARTFDLVAEQYPGLQRSIERRAALPDEVTPYDRFVILVDRVYRFPADDTLIARVVFSNPTDEVLRYRPGSVRLRVRDTPMVYPMALTDLSGEVPGATHGVPGQSFGLIAIAGNPDGTRADLSLRNRFDVLVDLQ